LDLINLTKMNQDLHDQLDSLEMNNGGEAEDSRRLVKDLEEQLDRSTRSEEKLLQRISLLEDELRNLKVFEEVRDDLVECWTLNSDFLSLTF